MRVVTILPGAEVRGGTQNFALSRVKGAARPLECLGIL